MLAMILVIFAVFAIGLLMFKQGYNQGLIHGKAIGYIDASKAWCELSNGYISFINDLVEDLTEYNPAYAKIGKLDEIICLK